MATHQVGSVFAPCAEGRGFESLIGSSQTLNNWHLLLSWLVFTI